MAVITLHSICQTSMCQKLSIILRGKCAYKNSIPGYSRDALRQSIDIQPRKCCDSEQHYAGLFAGGDSVRIPGGALHLADVRLAEQQHAHAALADAAAD